MAKQGETKVRKLKTNRGFLKTLLFTILTLGIYPCYLISAARKDLNLVCKDDGKKTAGFWKFFFLSIITLTIYSWVWYIKACNRMHKYLKAHGKRSRISGGGFFCWNTFGLLLIVGPIVAQVKYFRNWNEVNRTYNELMANPALPQQQGQTVNLGSQTLTFYSGVPATQTQQYSHQLHITMLAMLASAVLLMLIKKVSVCIKSSTKRTRLADLTASKHLCLSWHLSL